MFKKLFGAVMAAICVLSVLCCGMVSAKEMTPLYEYYTEELDDGCKLTIWSTMSEKEMENYDEENVDLKDKEFENEYLIYEIGNEQMVIYFKDFEEVETKYEKRKTFNELYKEFYNGNNIEILYHIYN